MITLAQLVDGVIYVNPGYESLVFKSQNGFIMQQSRGDYSRSLTTWTKSHWTKAETKPIPNTFYPHDIQRNTK